MPPQPPKRTAPRHSASTARRARVSGALTGGTGGFPHLDVLEGETALGRHRRPESLADPTVLRPAPTGRVAGGRRTTLDLSPRARTTSRSRPAARGGRHHTPAEPRPVTVSPLVSALYNGGRPPVIGSHRAPGTLPIESWLLIGRGRQQALLAALVAVGLMLIVFPMQRRDSDARVDTVAAADRSVVQPPTSKAPADTTPAKPGRPAEETGTAPAAPTPTTSAPAHSSAAPKPSAEPTGAVADILVPAGSGPGQSLRSTGTDTVALTFDDGPDPAQTPKILALLDKYDVKATFCLVGEQVKKHPEIVRDIVAAGHTLCNHTWNHSLTIGKDKPADIQKDLQRTNDAIHAAAPGAPIPFFRAPGGNFSKTLVQTAYTDGMTSLYWMVDPSDWDHPEAETDDQHITRVVKNIQDNAKPGAIILSHDFGQPDTILAYETLIPWLQHRFTLGLPSIPPAPAPSTPPAPGGAPSAAPSPAPSSAAP
ncbi:polysaccharide deacetylase family protein [Actinoplanes sp. N902-109]|uniref:polysaccharide deacetylase family protein n=1 Tax=Actinoplanes sp. (strain N902-109) TaxID=649831 RepID=UPI00032945E7|nr:polysaccharide deacetylase family protein [Actinoplanes sp. N902-109]AGL20682.1 polysaccharide deacetylase [Actinoplanes sp. N902-109]